MVPRGKLIALEGIDGSGKRTQLDLLASELDARGLATFRISFPRYESFCGELVGRYLNGEFGPPECTRPPREARRIFQLGETARIWPLRFASGRSGDLFECACCRGAPL